MELPKSRKFKQWEAEAELLQPGDQVMFWLDKSSESMRKSVRWLTASLFFSLLTVVLLVLAR